MKVAPRFLLAAFLLAALCVPFADAQGGKDGAVVNKAGIPIKLITRRDCKIFEKADPSSNAAPCRVFSFWYVLPPDAGAASRKAEDMESLTKEGFYRVAAGDGERHFKGWVHKDDVVEWHHRQALRFSPKTGRKLVHFFDEDANAETAAGSGDVGKALYREPESTGGALILMPLLKAKNIKVDDQEMKLFEMAFMAGKPATGGSADAPGPSEAPTVKEIREGATVDIVFVVDATASMEPVIEQVRKSITGVAESLRSDDTLRPRLRFGLVAYRDTVDGTNPGGLEYVTKVFCTLEDGITHETFLERLGQVQEAKIGSGDYAEDVLAGLDVAMSLDQLKWNPLGWKQIIIVGDSSIKEPDHPNEQSRRNEKGRTIAAAKATAQPGTGATEEMLKSAFVISAVRVKDPRAADDHAVGDRQFNQLVSGREYVGNLLSVGGGTSPEDFSSPLSKAILDGMEKFRDSVIKGGGRGVATAGATAAEFPYPVLDLIAAAKVEGESDAEKLKFASAFSSEFDNDGNRLFVPHVFVRKGQLMNFNAALSFLQGQLEEAGEPGSRDVAAIVKQMQVLTVTVQADVVIAADMPIDQFLQLLLGFPLKNDIFKVSIQDLAAMSQTDYDDWVKGVKAATDTLKQLIENPNIWFKLDDKAKDRDAHAFVRFGDLP